MRGFLGTPASFSADLNLVVQIAMGLALLFGALLARARRYSAHGACMTAVLLLNLVMIALVMWPSFHELVLPRLPARLGRRYYAVAGVHGALGFTAELFGLYVLLVAGTRVIPEEWRFRRWKLWMRVEFAIWWIVLLSGIGTYFIWYGPPCLH